LSQPWTHSAARFPGPSTSVHGIQDARFSQGMSSLQFEVEYWPRAGLNDLDGSPL